MACDSKLGERLLSQKWTLSKEYASGFLIKHNIQHSKIQRCL